MQPTIAIAFKIPEDILSGLRTWAHVVEHQDATALPASQWQTRLNQADGVLISVFNPVSADQLTHTAALRMISSVGVGLNHIDLKACQEAKVHVANTPGVINHPTADHAFALLLGASRNVVGADRLVRAGQWTQPIAPMMGMDVHHRRIGIVGFGGVGQQIARRAIGFDMRVHYHQRHRLPTAQEQALQATYTPLSELLQISDFVVLQVPYNPSTHHMIGARELALMPKHAMLVNTARGGVLDEDALADALEQGRIAGAALDVFENEPHINPRLLQAPNLLLTPHLGSATAATRHEMISMAANHLHQFFNE
ncbi:D-glycerate dehydrogenase [Lampropedia puyangensis]|uniref:D-glycerate dehydrogenase n=1 Tax=Lampropedia puyangensis TaxID=1330072 RepID=A0A4S8F6P8_9BURK|nr:D-glycerate dehydrogenase [Lampropedia puyangensis]THU01032.1 D-glycerate dehydrogenase [Lampropedia puyangensis]